MDLLDLPGHRLTARIPVSRNSQKFISCSRVRSYLTLVHWLVEIGPKRVGVMHIYILVQLAQGQSSFEKSTLHEPDILVFLFAALISPSPPTREIRDTVVRGLRSESEV
jgi:hypothetical protein